ncbi:MAG: PIG-L deacetylase family protein [Pirellulaceae bacterium]|jgi:LmbE family N-acetylglucosaminyl deacetylase|nr:PIG-L deacetylase family protein [Pirellulaceae bacterium]
MTDGPLRLLVLGAHPDDAEFHAGGLVAAYRAADHVVKIVSVTDGGAGHHKLSGSQLVDRRREEADRAGKVVGAEYVTWDFPDGHLQPSLEVRDRIIREIRTFKPDLVLTHRPCDYHPDHRAVGQAVQDASYLVTVPLVAPETPYLSRDPVVAYMVDLFTKPYPFQADVVLDIEPWFDTVLDMLEQHVSQVFEFLPYNHQHDLPADDDRRAWLADWCAHHMGPRADCFRQRLIERYGEERGGQILLMEAYEFSEYAAGVTPEDRHRLFLSDA